MLGLDPAVVAVVLAMSVVTYATKAGGLWLLGRVELSDRVESGLETLPGAVVVSILAPRLAGAGRAEWAAAGVVLLVTWRSENVLLALCCGVGTVLVLRASL
jgi:uncharacterized membrane protein